MSKEKSFADTTRTYRIYKIPIKLENLILKVLSLSGKVSMIKAFYSALVVVNKQLPKTESLDESYFNAELNPVKKADTEITQKTDTTALNGKLNQVVHKLLQSGLTEEQSKQALLNAGVDEKELVALFPEKKQELTALEKILNALK